MPGRGQRQTLFVSQGQTPPSKRDSTEENVPDQSLTVVASVSPLGGWQ